MKSMVFFFFALLSLSCTSLLKSYIEKPEVKVQLFEVHSISWSAAKLSLGLVVDNPNSFDIEISKLSYQVSTLEDKLLARGEWKQSIQIAAASSQQLVLPVEVKPAELIKLLPGILSELSAESPSVELMLDAKVEWKTWFTNQTTIVEQRLQL